MNCRRIEKLISLYVENDLDESESQAVSLHLDLCESCGALLNQYRDSQAWMKHQATAEFSDDFFDGIRRSVLIRIEEKSRANWMQIIIDRLRTFPAMAATAALLILIGGIALYSYLGKEAVNPNREQIAREQSPDQNEEKQAQPDEENPKERKAPENQHKRLPRPRRHDADVAVKQKVEKILSPPAVEQPGIISMKKELSQAADFEKRMEGMTRMEIQTKDPNIRIIWFAPKSDGSRSSRPLTD